MRRWRRREPAPLTGTPVGTMAAGALAFVDERGLVSSRAGWTLDWWIGADDRWHIPAREVAVRQRLVDDAPVVETAMRVPTGDAIHRVYGAASGSGDVLVVEIENRSKIPFAAAFAVHRPERVALLSARPPSRAAATKAGDLETIVTSGAATTDVPARPRGDAAYLFPVAHTATVRIALARRSGPMPVLPSADQVAKGWSVHLRGGLRAELPDARLASSITSNRAFELLVPDWEWPAGLVESLVQEVDGGLALLPVVPETWLGQGVEVHDAPTSFGTLSYAVRWHGDRPALLWELDGAARLTAPGLDPAWSTTEARGEVLLAPVPVPGRVTAVSLRRSP